MVNVVFGIRPKDIAMTELTMSSGFAQATALLKVQGQLRTVVRDPSSRSRYDLVVAIRQSLQARAQRGRFFNARLFSDPAWDILLELYAASLAQRRLSVSRLAERTQVPLTTVLRWISVLEKEGAVERKPDQLDARRVFILLSEQGTSAMAAYFDELPLESTLL
jgi:DNA-binding MarR family transcriptional regulator